MTQPDPHALIKKLGIQPLNPELLLRALTHGSHDIRGMGKDYQRLEFLGDRVLGLVIADILYHRFPHAKEGELSARLNQLVSRAICAEVGRAIDLGPYILLGKQARDDGGRDSDNILGDVVESLIGVVYVDAGMDAARRLVVRLWGDRFDVVASATKHPKSALLEWAAANRRKPPIFQITARDGPDHAPQFHVSVSIAHAGEASASGPSKQEAETAAASALLARLTPSSEPEQR